MDSLYSIVTRLSMDVTGFGAGASLATNLLQKIETQAVSAGRSVSALHTSLGLMAGGLAITGAGFILGDVLLHAARRGAELQVVMAGIGLATGATHAQMLALDQTFTAIGLKNQMSKTDAARIALAATHAGITDTRQLQMTIPTLANFAEVQNLSTGAKRETAATIGAEYAHLFGAYSAQLLVPLVNDLSKALTHTPLSAAGFLRLTSQFAGQTASVYGKTVPEQLRMQRDDTMMGVLLGQMGQGSRGGTQYGSALTRMATSREGSAIDRAIDFLEKAGKGTFFDAGGRFLGDRNMLGILQRDRAALPLDVLAAANKQAFGLVGMKLMGNLELPARLQQWDTNATTFARIPTIAEQQQVYNATAAGQSQQWHKNIETAVSLFGTALLPTLVRVSQAFVGITRAVVEFMSANRGVVAFAAGFALVATGAALVIGPMLTLVGAVGLLSIGFAALDLSLAPIVLTIVEVTAAAAASVWVWQNWATAAAALSGKLGPVWQGVAFLVSVLDPVLPLIGAISAAFHHWHEITTALGGVLGALGAILRPWVTLLTPIVQVVGLLAGAFGRWMTTTDLLVASVGRLTAPFRALGAAISTIGSAYNSLPAPLRGLIGGALGQFGQALVQTLPVAGPLLTLPPVHHHAAPPVVHHHAAPPVVHHHAAAIHHHAAPPVVHHHAAPPVVHHHAAPAPTQRGGDVHIHVAAGAVVNHIAPGHGYDPRKIAEEVTKNAGGHLGKGIADALQRSGMLPATTRPSLHQLG